MLTRLLMNRLPALALLAAAPLTAQAVRIDWNKVRRVSPTTPTLQVVVNPPLRRGSAIHERVFSELKQLGADYVRYVPWLPYPKLAVAELQPPANGHTSWDFSLIDPMTEDFLNATSGHPVILNFSTIPAWLFVTPKPIEYPADPDQVDWNYTQGAGLRDPSMKELGDYFARLVSWYVNGGFTDEFGKRHESGHHFKIDYWEVLNEIDFEHNMTPEQYTARYDAIVSAIQKVAPKMRFVGLALAMPSDRPEMFEYFLDHKHHQPGIPLDLISYHFYASPSADESPEVQQFTFFEEADRFLSTVRYIESIRLRLSPGTRTTVDEIGSISADDGEQAARGHVTKPIPDSYWNLSGATFAYVFAHLAELGIEVAGESQLVGYPTQFPSVSMLDWDSGAPNARFRVLQLLKDNFGPGDKIVDSSIQSSYVATFAVVKPNGQRKLLVINKRDRTFDLVMPEQPAQVAAVDQTTKGAPYAISQPSSKTLPLPGFAVEVVDFK